MDKVDFLSKFLLIIAMFCDTIDKVMGQKGPAFYANFIGFSEL